MSIYGLHSKTYDGLWSNHNSIAMTEGVRLFLENLGLVQYFDIFLIKGFDREDDICELNESDMDSLMISDPDHRRQILGAARCFQPSNEYRLYEWLRTSGLGHYHIGFMQSDITSLEEVVNMNLPDTQLYDELEITLPGHIRRLERAVNKLRKRLKTSNHQDTPLVHGKCGDTPLAHGRWAKPACLGEAKFDFLVVDATVISTRDRQKFNTIEFMVDSGSDVTTIREEILEGLNLELLGRIHSKGVHGSKTTNLYRAILQIGTQELQIEVMGESYDSLGSRVVRHFKHFIDGEQHLWMKSDYCDNDMMPRHVSAGSQSAPANSRNPSTSSSAYPSSSTSYRSTTESMTSSQRTDMSLSQPTDFSQDTLPSNHSSQIESQGSVDDPHIEQTS